MATTKTRRCIGSARFGIEPHDAPITASPKQPSQKDGLGRMCAPHWKTYVKGLNAERKARLAAGDQTPAKPVRAKAEPKAPTKRERRRTPRASTPAPKPESPRVRKARQRLAATEKLSGTAYTEAIGSDEVQAALEIVNGNGHDVASEDMTEEQREAVEAIATEADPRSEEEIRALED